MFVILFLVGCQQLTGKPWTNQQNPAAGGTVTLAPVTESPWDVGVAESPLGVLRMLKVENVVVVEVDTLRADHLSFYGSDRDTLPRTQARGGWLVSKDHISATSWTNPSVASMLTGLDTHEHTIATVSSLPTDIQITDAPMVQAWLADRGFDTAWFNGNVAVDRSNVADGWLSAQNVEDSLGNGLATVNAGLQWLDSRPSTAPFVVHLRPYDPHRPWGPMLEDRGTFVDPALLPFSYEDGDEVQTAAVEALVDGDDALASARVQEQVRAVYDEEILGLDRALIALLDGLALRGLDTNTLVVLTADHGETLFDRGAGEYGHGTTLKQEQVHVPLVFLHPQLDDVEVGGCASQTWDVYPTLLDLLGVTPMPDGAIPVRGRSMLDSCRSDVQTSLFHRVGADEDDALQHASVTRWPVKLVANCEEQRCVGWDLDVDPGEVAAGASCDTNPELLAKLNEYIEEIALAIPSVRCGLTPVSP